MTLEQFIEKYTTTETENRDSMGTLYHGFSPDPVWVRRDIPERFNLVNDWSIGNQRMIWVSPKERATIVCCERDIYVVVLDSEEEYTEEIKEMWEFYSN